MALSKDEIRHLPSPEWCDGCFLKKKPIKCRADNAEMESSMTIPAGLMTRRPAESFLYVSEDIRKSQGEGGPIEMSLNIHIACNLST